MMAFIAQFWLPILLSAVAIFIASALIWMVAPHHKKEWRTHPNEAQVLAAIRGGGATPGAYLIPHAQDPNAMKDPAFQARMAEGNVGTLFLRPPGMPSMGRLMGQQFIYFLVVTALIAVLMVVVLPPSEGFMIVLKSVGLAAFMAYGFAVIPESIWFGRPWKSCVLTLVDAAIYAAITAAIFAKFWPQVPQM